jgi:CTP synthase (UTP-ammonia lyase)
MTNDTSKPTKQNWLSLLVYGNQQQICQECQDASSRQIEKLKTTIEKLLKTNSEQNSKIKHLDDVIFDKNEENNELKVTIITERHELQDAIKALEHYKTVNKISTPRSPRARATSKSESKA